MLVLALRVFYCVLFFSIMINQEVEILLARYMAGTATAEEKTQLAYFFSDDRYREDIYRFLEKSWLAHTDTGGEEGQIKGEKSDQLFSSLVMLLHEKEMEKNRRRVIRRWVTAASVIFLLGAALMFAFYTNLSPVPKKTDSVAVTPNEAVIYDVAAPSTSLATLQVNGAGKVSLQDTGNHHSVEGAPVRIDRVNGKSIIDYTKIKAGTYNGRKVPGNELANPRGSRQIILYLSDGTKVMLNAGSRIKYPSLFEGTLREVELSGEAYFEVAKNAAKPFKVYTRNGSIQVLGTHFNVNTEKANKMEVTLLEGSVKVNRGNLSNVLKPGQKAIVTQKIDLQSNADTAQVVAWTNDLFDFKGVELSEILRQVTEWYDVRLDGNLTTPDMKLSGKVSRDLPISKVLELLSLSSGLQFTMINKEVKINY